MSERDEIKYDSWPIGRVPVENQRPELEEVRRLGYSWSDPRDVISIFEEKVAKFAGAKYGVAVDCCSHGLFLAMNALCPYDVNIPRRTYVSVPMQVIHANCRLSFRDEDWSGVYQLAPYPIYDAAVRWRSGMYRGGIHVVSFQLKKRIPIGRGGMVLTDNASLADEIRTMSYDGRDLTKPYDQDDPEVAGYHYYMTPEDAARGIILMDRTPGDYADSGNWNNYSDVSKMTFVQQYMENQKR